MPTYATLTQVRDEVADAPADDAELTKLIERAERDIDRSVGAYRTSVDTGRKFDPTTLETVPRDALMRATCEQVRFRLLMGERFFTRPQHTDVSGPDYTTKGKLQRIGPATVDELESGGLFKLTTTWGPAVSDPPWKSFVLNVD